MRLATATFAIALTLGWSEQARAADPVVQETRVKAAGGVSLNVRKVGTEGPVVVAPFASLHGTQLDRLGRSARLVLFDPRGRGRSDAVTPDQVSLDHLLSDFGVIQDSAGLESRVGGGAAACAPADCSAQRALAPVRVAGAGHRGYRGIHRGRQAAPGKDDCRAGGECRRLVRGRAISWESPPEGVRTTNGG